MYVCDSKLLLTRQALPPVDPVEVEIPEDAPLTLIGTINQIVQNMIIVQASVSGDYQVLDADSILLTSDRKVIGKVRRIIMSNS